ncbi:MAG: serine/threonine-protein kinase [Kiritimatiellia bacterium]
MAETEQARIGDFQIEGKIGEGSLGTVFKAVCLADGPPPLRKGLAVALKKLHPSADLTREMKALQALAHPHIVRFFSCFVSRPGEWDEAPFLVTELLEGCDLARHLQGFPSGLPWEEAKRLLDQTLDALAFAESQGVTHRDLKPSNLFVCRDGSVKIIDFGLARRTGGTVSVAEAGRAGGLTGTLDYMAPEFARIDGFRGDALSDLFSFGVLASQILTGQLPFPPLGEHPEIAFIRRWTGPQPPRAILPRPIAYAWEGAGPFLARVLHVNREARFPHFDAAREALAGIRPRVLAGGREVYTLEAFVASGGFCDVFRGRAERGGGPVAIKRLHAGRHEWRFRREAGLLDALQSLEHPALVKVHELVEEPGPDGAPCLVMEYLPGEDLRRRLSDGWEAGGLAPAEVARLFIRYLEGLEALHRRGIAHRDIKPANLYAPVGKAGEAKLLDLGIACEKEGTLSMNGMPPGTLDYMAPELASGAGSRGSPQADLFALGCSLYEALTGRPAFKRLPREDAAALRGLCARSESESAFLAAFEGFELPVFEAQPEWAAVIGRALQYNPEIRYGGREEEQAKGWQGAGARAMRVDLEALLEQTASGPGGPVSAGASAAAPPTSDLTVALEPPPPPKRRRRVWLAAGLALLAAAGAPLIWSGLPEAEKPAASAVSEPVPLREQVEPPVQEPAVRPDPPAAEVPPELPTPAPVVPAPEAPRVVIRPAPAAPKPIAVPVAPVASRPAVPPEPAGPVAAAPDIPAPPIPDPPPAPAREPVEAELGLEEKSIDAWRDWLFRVNDPLQSLTLKRYEQGLTSPAWKGQLPFLLAAEREAMPAGLRWRYERAHVWEQAVPGLNGAAAFQALGKALRGVAERARAEDPGTADQCLFDSALVEWDGRTPPDPGKLPALPEAGIWLAHALAASGDDQDCRDVLAEIAGYAGQPGAQIRVEDALLALRAADTCLGGLVRDIREKTSADVVKPGTGRAVRDPVAAYALAVERVREEAAGAVRRLLIVAGATGPGVARAMEERLRTGVKKGTVGDYAWSVSELGKTPWRESRQTGLPRPERLAAEDRAILGHVLGYSPLPKRPEELPLARLR